MADIVLFHHVLGLTDGVVALADDLRTAGHAVLTPDLFEGRTFDSIDAGAAHVDEVGFPTILERGLGALDDRPDGSSGTVYVGISLGVVPAQAAAQTRPDARGAVLLEACVPPTEFGDGWPTHVPVQIHGMSDDPFFVGEGDIDAARAIVGTEGVDGELFVHPGDRHLFVDRSLPSHDREAATLVVERMIAFVGRIG